MATPNTLFAIFAVSDASAIEAKLSVRIDGIERSITYLEGHADTAGGKLDTITSEIAAAKASFGTLKWILGAICIGIWGPLTGFALMWAKHHFSW